MNKNPEIVSLNKLNCVNNQKKKFSNFINEYLVKIES